SSQGKFSRLLPAGNQILFNGYRSIESPLDPSCSRSSEAAPYSSMLSRKGICVWGIPFMGLKRISIHKLYINKALIAKAVVLFIWMKVANRK
ncbi:hypothetical protein, partial [Marinomonas sp. BSi20584]|uniref:hypothetical protein n=1 Tax=Marinomonas sp. BSi20584 TaxID=1594462 RepID=UPI001E315FE4